MRPYLVHLDSMLDYDKHYLPLILTLATLGILCTNFALQKHHLQYGKSVYLVFYQRMVIQAILGITVALRC
jgi:hypothetical protein